MIPACLWRENAKDFDEGRRCLPGNWGRVFCAGAGRARVCSEQDASSARSESPYQVVGFVARIGRRPQRRSICD
jgi:hypothetical protein